MNIEIRSSTVPLSEALAEHISRRLTFALRRFADTIEHVVVRLIDLNGPKGGLDKRCRIAARLTSRTPSIVVEATDADAYVAVSQAAARLDERVARALSKKRDWVASTRQGLRRRAEQSWVSVDPKHSA